MLPAGYIISNVEDMSNYLIAQLNNGKYNKEQIFSSSIIKQVQTPSATIFKDKFHYGFGWFINTSEDIILYHLGEVPGYTSAMIIYPKEKLGLVVLTNTTSYTLGNKDLNALSGGILNILRNKEVKNSEIDIVSISAYIFFIGLFIVQLFLIKYFIKRFKEISKYKITSLLILDIIIAVSLFLILPKMYDLTFNGFLLFVPDIGYIILGSIIIAILGAIWKIILTIKETIYNKS